MVEGRDIGTVVAPNAQLKIYLHADISERAKRRESEMAENIGKEKVGQSLANRDEIDSNRKISPSLKQKMLQLLIQQGFR